jgi:GntR family transcriptional regulator/MocR family aminotransferase
VAKASSGVVLGNLSIDRNSDEPLHRQLYGQLREAILGGMLPGGTRLPATRILASETGLSRNTVVEAFEQLLAEGYVESRVGSGTRVAMVLPDQLLMTEAGDDRQAGSESGGDLSRRGRILADARPINRTGFDNITGEGRPFSPGLPAMDRFPWTLWRRLMSRRMRNPDMGLLHYGDPQGYRPLREAIAAHIAAARGVKANADQVIVLSGSQQALDLTARLLLDPGDRVWVEDPCYPGARGALAGAGAEIVPLRIDSEGLDVEEGRRLAPDARLAFVTPSHQYPLGVTMTLQRRLALLEWSRESGGWIIEDDYDSDYRFTGRPVPAMQGLDGAGRVIYIGSFSKVMFPSIRLGYMVVPERLMEAFIAARNLIDGHSPTLTQAVMTDFIEGGHFTGHIRRMRALYAERQEKLFTMAKAILPDFCRFERAETGMHFMCWLPDGMSDRAVSEAARKVGITATPLSTMTLSHDYPPALALGFASTDGIVMRDGLRKLASVLEMAERNA